MAEVPSYNPVSIYPPFLVTELPIFSRILGHQNISTFDHENNL